MHLGLVIHGGLDRLSGGFLYDRMLVQHLQASGWRVDVFALPWGSYLSSLALNLSAQLLSEIESSSIDLLVEDELSHPSLFALNRGVRRHIQIPIVSVVHHLRSDEGRSAWMNPFYRVLERTYLRGVDAAVCNSLATQRSLEALLDRRLPSVVAYPGRDPILPEIDPEQIRTRAIAAGPLKVVFLGNVIPRKGLLVLVEALSSVSAGDWRLEIIGDLTADPSHTRRLRRAIEQAGVADRVNLAGRLDGAALGRRLMECHVMVVPASYEGFGIAYLDGMAYGLPALATTAGGAGELVRHGHNGYLIPPNDAQGLAAGLVSLMKDRRTLAKMGLAALETYRSHPTWSESAELVRRFLFDLRGDVSRFAMAGRRSPYLRARGGSP